MLTKRDVKCICCEAVRFCSISEMLTKRDVKGNQYCLCKLQSQGEMLTKRDVKLASKSIKLRFSNVRC